MGSTKLEGRRPSKVASELGGGKLATPSRYFDGLTSQAVLLSTIPIDDQEFLESP